MPLAMMKIGDKARVTAVMGGDAAKKHLGSLGIIPGTVVTIIQATEGNLILGIQDSRIAVNDELARRVMATPM